MGRQLRALIIEDSEDDCTLMLRELQRGGYDVSFERVTTAAGLYSALDKGEWGILLADYSLPQFGAIPALTILKNRGLDIPFIIVSGSIGEETAVAAMKAGAHDYIMKDQPARLLPAVERELRDAAERQARREAEETLRESEEKFTTAFEFANSGMALVSRESRFLRVNKAFCDMLGYTHSEMLATTLEAVTHLEDIESSRANTEALCSGDNYTCALEQRYVHKSGAVVWSTVSISGVRDNKGDIPYLIVMIQDVSERQRLEDQLRQAQKMEAIGRLAGGVAHDFNNLLTAILGYSQLVLRRLDERDTSRAEIEEVVKAGERASSLVSQLLAFSRKQMVAPKVLDINAIVRDLHKLLGRLIGEDIELSIRLSPELHNVKADQGQIEQVMLNLAVNARDAMPQGGSLVIETGNAYLDRRYCQEHIGVEPGNYTMIAVGDTGCGMDKETLSHIFEPFFTTKDQGKGTGLGLSTVYGMVKQSRGHIWVCSEIGKGTTFKIYLPSSDEGVESIPASHPVGPLRGSETVLIVEDEEPVRTLVRQVLEMNGYSVLEAANGLEALDIWQRKTGKIELLLTDLVMPKLSGNELAQRLTGLSPTLKVIYMSGYTDRSLITLGVMGNGAHFLEKPFTPTALARKVRQVLEESPHPIN